MPLAQPHQPANEMHPHDRRTNQVTAPENVVPLGVSIADLSCRTIAAKDLDPELANRWEQMRQVNGALRSPFFAVEFTQAVSQVRDDCWVAVVEAAGVPVGFLPYHRDGRTLFPIGRMINDAHGIVSDGKTLIPWAWVLDQLDANAYQYHALFAGIEDADDHAFGWTKTFLCDLRASELPYAHWLEQNRKTIFKQRRKTRRLIREEGHLRLEYACSDPAVLERLIELKRAQYQNTRIFDIFSVAWIRDLMFLMLEHQKQLQGRLSALYAGDQLVAIHMGIQEGTLLHYWFPVFDRAFGYASPGTALFLEIVQSANEHDIDMIDFGYGELPYKWTLNNVVESVPYGAACTSAAGWHARRFRHRAGRAARALPGKELSKRILRAVHPQFGGNHYQ